ncbi:hypothetical protein FRC08_007564 [Ceratobasidium sp. 394]|nr:hypothetical protein FRC08_007564 [Ceratobasidium sp. 394]
MHSNGYTDNIEPDAVPMTWSPASQIIVLNLTEDGTVERNGIICSHNSCSMAATFDPSVTMRHPSTPPRTAASGQAPRRRWWTHRRHTGSPACAPGSTAACPVTNLTLPKARAPTVKPATNCSLIPALVLSCQWILGSMVMHDGDNSMIKY